MATSILLNRKNTSAVLHFASANGLVITAGNSTTTNVDGTSVCLATDNEVLGGVSIVQAIYGVDPASDGCIVVKRGSNVVAVFDSTGTIDYAGTGMAITKDAAANLVVEFDSTANAYLMLEVQKIVTPANSDYFVG